MQIDRTDIVYGGIAGALLGLAYQIGRAWYGGDASTAFDASLLGAAAVGAIAGILALTLRKTG